MRVCNTCGWFRRHSGVVGNCTNPRNSEVQYVGGGGEYSSSAQCLVAPRIYANYVCGWHEEFKREVPVEAARIVKHPRTPEMRPWEDTQWELTEL